MQPAIIIEGIACGVLTSRVSEWWLGPERGRGKKKDSRGWGCCSLNSERDARVQDPGSGKVAVQARDTRRQAGRAAGRAAVQQDSDER